MQFKFLHNTNIDFIGKRHLFFIISAILVLIGAASLIIKGPNYGIDFSGGILMQVGFEQQLNMADVRSALDSAGIKSVELQSSRDKTGKTSVIIRVKKSDVNEDEFAKKVTESFSAKFAKNPFDVERTEYVGPAVGKHLSKQAFYALIFAFLGIIVYVGIRFHAGIWGMAGVIGIMHDVFVIFGLFSLFGKEITLTVIAALLTIAGYSINDTIVVFDRIRENLKYLAKENLKSIMNKSINQTLSRTIITSLTVFIVVVVLFFVGGEVLHDFAFAMILGVVIGTYSSIYVCSALVYEWEEGKKKRLQYAMSSMKGYKKA
ncbi:MAG: protein translocase subunit SecF [Elusimicrobia bacterium]|nr:protein translocase subunit SecF [Elusimicrobiota bacterium]